jgi:hypothetical protein
MKTPEGVTYKLGLGFAILVGAITTVIGTIEGAITGHGAFGLLTAPIFAANTLAGFMGAIPFIGPYFYWVTMSWLNHVVDPTGAVWLGFGISFVWGFLFSLLICFVTSVVVIAIIATLLSGGKIERKQ